MTFWILSFFFFFFTLVQYNNHHSDFIPVSMSLCEIPPPSQELVDKYEMMKSTFYKRLLNLYGRLQEKAAPMMQTVGETEHGQAAKTIIENAQRKPELQAAIKVASWVNTLYCFTIWCSEMYPLQLPYLLCNILLLIICYHNIVWIYTGNWKKNKTRWWISLQCL